MGTTKKYLLVLTGLAALFAGGQQARAAFELNFLPHPEKDQPGSRIMIGGKGFQETDAQCNMPGNPREAFCIHGQNTDAPDKTPFLREYIELLNPDGTGTGEVYVHMIVGGLTTDPVTKVETGFAQEIYIRSGSGNYSMSGGKPGCDQLAPRCDNGTGSAMPMHSGSGQLKDLATIGDPLSGNQHLTGSATGDPTRVIIRQALKDDLKVAGVSTGRIEQEFLKGSLLTKPKITQNFTSTSGGTTMTSQFVMDMSLINYDTNTTSGVMVNKLTLNDLTIPVASRSFDVTANSQIGKGDVTAGRYKFTPGAGWVDRFIHGAFVAPGGTVVARDETWLYQKGTYNYIPGASTGIDTIDWKAFKNPSDNPPISGP